MALKTIQVRLAIALLACRTTLFKDIGRDLGSFSVLEGFTFSLQELLLVRISDSCEFRVPSSKDRTPYFERNPLHPRPDIEVRDPRASHGLERRGNS